MACRNRREEAYRQKLQTIDNLSDENKIVLGHLRVALVQQDRAGIRVPGEDPGYGRVRDAETLRVAAYNWNTAIHHGIVIG